MQYLRYISFTVTFTVVSAVLFGSNAFVHEANAQTRNITFPVLGSSSYSNDFGAPRSGHTHEGNDIIAAKGTPVVAAVDGTITQVAYPQPDYGYAIFLEDVDGYKYWYLHLNNDSPGTDDGNAGGMTGYAPYAERGAKVKAGQIIGYVGDSGNAESTVSHLHFEIHDTNGTPFNPYPSLQSSAKVGTPPAPYRLANEILPFDNIAVQSHVAVGDVFGDDADEIIIGAGPGGGPHIRVYDQGGTLLSSFFAYGESFRGGVDVAVGDIDGDGKSEIITGAGPGGGPQVRIFTGDGTVVSQFFAYDEAFRGGVRVAAADLNGNGKSAVITVAGPGGGPHVRIFKSTGKPLKSFFALDGQFRGGMDIAAVSGTRDTSRIITVPTGGGGPNVQVFDKRGNITGQFWAFQSEFRGGVRLAVRQDLSDLTKANESTILVTPASSGSADIREFSLGGNVIQSKTEFEPWWRGGFDVAGNADIMVVSSLTGHFGITRRASVRIIDDSNNGGNNGGGNWWGN